MNDFLKYDPEDIESLLLHKQFHELYPEEKEFVLRHLESEAEYESLRKTLFELHDASRNDEWLEPDASLKRELMREFSSERRGRFTVWLNSLFAMPELPWYRQRGFALSLGMAALAVGVFFFYSNQQKTELAQVEQKTPAVQQKVDTLQFAQLEQSSSTVVDVPSTLPPAPELLVQQQPPAAAIKSIELSERKAAEEADSENLALAYSEEATSPSEDTKTTTDNVAFDQTTTAGSTTTSAAPASAYNNQLADAAVSLNKTSSIKASSNVGSIQSQNAASLSALLSELYTAK